MVAAIVDLNDRDQRLATEGLTIGTSSRVRCIAWFAMLSTGLLYSPNLYGSVCSEPI